MGASGASRCSTKTYGLWSLRGEGQCDWDGDRPEERSWVIITIDGGLQYKFHVQESISERFVACMILTPRRRCPFHFSVGLFARVCALSPGNNGCYPLCTWPCGVSGGVEMIWASSFTLSRISSGRLRWWCFLALTSELGRGCISPSVSTFQWAVGKSHVYSLSLLSPRDGELVYYRGNLDFMGFTVGNLMWNDCGTRGGASGFLDEPACSSFPLFLQSLRLVYISNGIMYSDQSGYWLPLAALQHKNALCGTAVHVSNIVNIC